MIRLVTVIVLAAFIAPAWAWELDTAAGRAEYCRYLQEGTLVRSIERPDYCEPLPSSKTVDLFWNLTLAGAALVAIGWHLTKRRS